MKTNFIINYFLLVQLEIKLMKRTKKNTIYFYGFGIRSMFFFLFYLLPVSNQCPIKLAINGEKCL